ncbi:uncharacterized protein KQ657_005003 [Scheffersomyces spartinae]|uniref:U3 small nucleolar RNA-associated protein 8 n=1 Tax=Scheffersomyces spartinae TaxID=45513 RepID=A0A9P7VA68_9ASCO|nr:uncharacterized protein KQ657_005003 [Scheffersomyces spartinae]KAG7194276.1 hypothetical protein KQ657_005003 [Scheffersomyces spartinae]
MSLSESYMLATLPRVQDLPLLRKLILPQVSEIDASYLKVGITKSFVGSYVLRPTPKLIWSYPLNPAAVLECMDELAQPGKDSEDTYKGLYAMGITERKSNRLLVVDSRADEPIRIEIKLTNRPHAVKFLSSEELAVICEGYIVLYKLTNGQLEELESTNISLDRILFHQFISEFNNELLVLIAGTCAGKVVYKLISLDFSSLFFEVKSSNEFDYTHENHYTYNAGMLYKLNPESKVIECIQISDFEIKNSIDISSLFTSPKHTEISSILSPAPNRLLISLGNTIYLINVTFESLLAKYTIEKSDMIALSQVVGVKGSSMNTRKTNVYFVSHNNKKNTTQLFVMNVDTSLNKLSDCLGKSLHKTSTNEIHGVANIVNKDFVAETNASKIELNQIYEKLHELSTNSDVNNWERVVVPYCKQESWESIQKSLSKPKKSLAQTAAKAAGKNKVYHFQEFDEETDRALDLNFVKKCLGLIFKIDEKGTVKLINNEFIPQFTLVYLLTNSLFPYEYTKGLLPLLANLEDSTLLHQAVRTCPNLSLEEILKQLIETDAKTELGLFEDILSRVNTEYSIHEITREFKSLAMGKTEFNLEQALNNLLVANSMNSWILVQAIMDVGGLFNWSLVTINKLSDLIDKKVNSLVQNNYNLIMTDQLLLASESVYKKWNKKKSPKASSSASASVSNGEIVDKQQQQLDSIINIDNFGIEVAKKIPTYSIEKLVI